MKCGTWPETETFSSTVTVESFKINHRFNCNDVIVLNVSCTKPPVKCNKQYTGQTTDSFGSGWNNYKSKSSKFKKNEKKCIQEYLYSHFESEGHSVFREDESVTLINKTDDSDPTKREKFWMRMYIALFVVSRSNRKSFLIDFINIYLFPIYFF